MLERKPFWAGTPVRQTRRGHLWIPGERVRISDLTYQRGPLFAEWETPQAVTQPFPIVLLHGGGYQATEWLDTPDGRPGWAQRLVEAAYATVLVDRPGQGRSPYTGRCPRISPFPKAWRLTPSRDCSTGSGPRSC